MLALKTGQRKRRGSGRGVSHEHLIPFLRHVELLTVLHPDHLNVWLRNLTFKNCLLFLCDLDVFDFLGEIDHTS